MHISLVEDDPIIAKAVSTALHEAGHECSWIADGEKAIKERVVLSSDLVVLDLMLPKASGIEVLREARQAGVRTPVIVLTAKGTVPDKLAGDGARGGSAPSEPVDEAALDLRPDLGAHSHRIQHPRVAHAVHRAGRHPQDAL
jgi:DNA-binding response OmpR family regulator